MSRRRPTELQLAFARRPGALGNESGQRLVGIPMSASSEPLAAAVEVVPLGGLGEFVLHMMAVSCGDTTILIDAGTMFPKADLPGVDLVVPSLEYLDQRGGKVDALVLTHGHEDHIGGLPYLMEQGLQGPVFATALTRRANG